MFVIVHCDPATNANGPFDTYEEAVQYCIDEYGVTEEEADDGGEFWISEVTK